MTRIAPIATRVARRIGGRIGADRRGTAALEFAMVGGLLVILLLGCVEIGLMMWTGSALQSVAAQTARCTAIGACANPQQAQQFAVSLAGQWIGANAITTNDVTVAAGTSCHGQAGAFAIVTISESIWSGTFLKPITGGVQSVMACFPTG